jgi:CRISPR-associated protein Cas1
MTDNQLEFHLPAPPVSGDTPLIPARMVNEFVYCPRLAYLMWTQGEWSETGDTVEGKRVHGRVDKPSAPLPAPETLEADEAPTGDKIVGRSLTLSSATLGVIAKLDVAEAEDGMVKPIDYKRGRRPHIAQGVYEPERIQVCLQALLLEENGYRVEEGAIYYAESRERVRITLDETLRSAAQVAVSELRLTVSQSRIPPPLKDSPKCPRCALVTVCLPDEVRSLSGSSLAPRTIAVPPDEALPLIVQSQHARIGKEGETLKITDEEKGEAQVRFIDISDVALYGNVSITTPALTALLEREIPVTFHSHGGWFRGVAHGIGHRNVEIRTAQYRMSFDEAACLRFAKALVAAKITNQRTILRRNWRGPPEERQAALDRLGAARKSVDGMATLAQLLGVEGDAAAVYFRAFAGLLKSPEDKQGAGELAPFRFEARNRRPPTDPINAMLSLAYAMLTRHLTVALASVGFDPYRGFYHAPRYGRPALALDLMEPFRAIIADSVVAVTGTALTQAGRRRFVEAFERRLSQETTHPVFGYQVSMRRMLLVQARLLSRFLLGELPTYPHYLPR